MPATFSASSIDKAFALLEFLAAAGKAVSLQEVTEAVRLPKPTAYRLLQSLQKLGYVSRPAGSRDYSVGPRTARLVGPDVFSALKSAARPLLRRLHESFNETANLGVLSGGQISYLDFLETTQALRYIVTPGQSDPFYCTALGRAIAATLTTKHLDRLLAAVRFQALTPFTVKNSDELRGRIDEATRRGYAEEREESTVGVSCIAVPLAAIGFAEAAISVAVPVQRLTVRRRAAIVRELKALALT